MCAYNPSYSRGSGKRIASLRPTQAKVKKTLSQEQNKNKRAGGIPQVVECLPGKNKALG
jgi:hypothetical protein